MYPCPVCGYLTFAEPPGSYAICEVCGWEDDALQLEFATSLDGGANKMTLAKAQLDYAKRAARLARKHSASTIPIERDPSWRPIDPQHDRFRDWNDEARESRPAADVSLYYWRDTFWNRRRGG
jgi:hypothetical protein